MKRMVRTICQACHCECGVLVEVEDGRLTKVKGDPEHPMNRGFTCIKGRAQPQVVYHPDRVIYPLRRVGERGGGKWEKVSWNTALEEIAEKLTALKDKYGPESFSAIHGTGPRPTHYSTALLAYALGSPNVISTDFHICFVPSVVGWHWTMGHCAGIENGPDYLNANCIMVVGGNPLASHPPRGVDILEARRKRQTKLIVVDPYRTVLAEKADLWLRIRPGTDVALALGMMKVIIDEALYDQGFVSQWCHGFEALKERVKQYVPEKVEAMTWIPADQIRRAARLYATTKPAAMHHRVAIEHNINSTQTARALAILVALTGNIDVPGGNVFPTPVPGCVTFGQIAGESRRFRPEPKAEARRLGAEAYPLISGPEAVIPFVAAPVAHETLVTGHPYPLKSMFSAGGNPVINMQHVKSVRNALKGNLELFVVADFFLTPTAEIADYVLPVATWLERDDLCSALYPYYVSARQKAIEPLGEAWHDVKISIELVKRLPWANRSFLPWNTVEEFNESLVKNAGFTFEELKEKSHVAVPLAYKKYEKEGFNTPTGKVEFYSTAFEKHGYDPLPFYSEPPESPVSTPSLMSSYPYILCTGNRHIEYFHSEGRQIPTLRHRVPDPLVEIHPETAKGENIQEGDWVWIETPQIKGERVKLKAKITDRVHPRIIHARHGWWFPETAAPEHGCFESNVNVVLSDGAPREAICASVRTRGTLCKIYK